MYVIENYIAHVHTKFQADNIFGPLQLWKDADHPIGQWYQPSFFSPRFWHYDVFYECFRTSIVIVQMNFYLKQLFLCIYSNIFGIFQFRQLIENTWFNETLITYDLTSTT